MAALPNRLRELRESAGLSQAALGQKVNLSGMQISRLETGDRQLNIYWIERLARALGAAPGDFFLSNGCPDSNGAEIHDPAPEDPAPEDLVGDGASRGGRGRKAAVPLGDKVDERFFADVFEAVWASFVEKNLAPPIREVAGHAFDLYQEIAQTTRHSSERQKLLSEHVRLLRRFLGGTKARADKRRYPDSD